MVIVSPLPIAVGGSTISMEKGTGTLAEDTQIFFAFALKGLSMAGAFVLSVDDAHMGPENEV